MATHPKRLVVASVVALVAALTLAQAPASALTATERLDCIAERESERIGRQARYDVSAHVAHAKYRQGYGAVNPSGRYRGRYQFDARTWAGAARTAGHGEWARTPVNLVPPQVQDDAAGALMAARGLQPWPTSRRRCR